MKDIQAFGLPEMLTMAHVLKIFWDAVHLIIEMLGCSGVWIYMDLPTQRSYPWDPNSQR